MSIYLEQFNFSLLKSFKQQKSSRGRIREPQEQRKFFIRK
ncbi:hypothetical protein FAM8407_00519 [Lacticaseibacillus paracasei]|nr:hypothetical protein AC564_0950 [Lacticaseibacillus paracasei]NMN63883.1 hypothetical protein [Lacticaseibacillus casei]OUC72980.1 hypothetical protein B4Q23_1740c [Lacticaseibacillus paracasei]OUC73400.1 hypothetical protein BWK52_0672 [Lacticaseibacillus paracasei]RND49435.1 hypothetical protein FAM18108_00669 [Lacticaseibacillus paracasei]